MKILHKIHNFFPLCGKNIPYSRKYSVHSEKTYLTYVGKNEIIYIMENVFLSGLFFDVKTYMIFIFVISNISSAK